jgi:ABC-type multidrug transport system ATPase subunit
MESGGLLVARALRVRFPGARAPLLDGLDLEVVRGENVALVGPNGCGKTTLLAALVGLVPFESGEVVIAGEGLDPRDGRARRHVGWVGDEYPVQLKLTVREYLALVASLHALSREVLDARLKHLRTELRLSELEPVWLEVCSHGMTKRAMLAAALLPDPPLLLLDEPESGLDGSALSRLTRILDERRARGGAAIVATHRTEWAARICDRVVTFEGGRLVETPIEGRPVVSLGSGGP